MLGMNSDLDDEITKQMRNNYNFIEIKSKSKQQNIYDVNLNVVFFKTLVFSIYTNHSDNSHL